MVYLELSTQKEVYKYRIEETEKGVKVMVQGDAIEETVADYIHLRTRLEQEGIKVMSNEEEYITTKHY